MSWPEIELVATYRMPKSMPPRSSPTASDTGCALAAVGDDGYHCVA